MSNPTTTPDIPMEDLSRAKTLRWFLSLTALEGVLAIAWLVLLPGSAGAFSLGRLALITPGLLLVVGLAWAALAARRRPEWAGRLDLARRDGLYWAALALCTLVIVLSANLLLAYWLNTDRYVQAYLERLAPYGLWGLLASLQAAIALRRVRFGADRRALPGEHRTLVGAGIALLALLLAAGFMAATRLGLAPDSVAWGDPGVPLFGWQIAIALGLALILLLLGGAALAGLKKAGWLLPAGLSAGTLDLLICLALWAGAAWRWGAEPLRPSYFSPDPLPPTQEFFPYSDAASYDVAAQSLLAGYGLGQEAVRPFYSFFLAIAHAASGTGYQGALIWQLPLLALLPPLLYLFARSLHSRLAGVFVGLLAIVQNANAIQLAGAEDVSHAKLLMSDLPTALGIVAILTLLVFWLEKPAQRAGYPLIAGGLLGVVMLVRVQVVALLPVALLTVWLGGAQPKRPWRQIGLLLGGFGCVLLPWLWRNWQMSGRLVLSEASQTSQIGLIGLRYSTALESGKNARLPGESDDQYSSRMVRSALEFVRQNPGEAARFITAHFLHNQVATFLVLPSALPTVDFLMDMLTTRLLGQTVKAGALWERCCTPRNTLRDAVYWNDWDGRFENESLAPLLLGLLAIALGLGAAWQRGWLRAALPLGFSLSYSLTNALVRNSGWRFNQPVDWVGYLFYGVGIAQLCLWARAYFTPASIPADTDRVGMAPAPGGQTGWAWRGTLLAGGLFLLLSAAIPISENLIPERYGDIQVEATLSELEAEGWLASAGMDAQEMRLFLAQDQAEARVGRALYPRYYQAGDGEPGSGWPSFTPRPYERLAFYLVGPTRRHVVLRTPAAPPRFPHASDVLVLGCAVEDYLDAYLVVTLDPNPVVLERSPLESWKCP